MNELASHDLSILRKGERALAQQHVAPDEHVRFCLVGHKGHALIALDRRVVVIKAGTFGGRAASFEFAEIDAIQVDTGKNRGSIEILTAALGTIKADDFWTTDDAMDRFKVPNALPIASSDVQAYEPYVAELRSLISDAKQPFASVLDAHEHAWDDLVRELLSDAALADATGTPLPA